MSAHDELIVDIALDSPPDLPPAMSILGPTFAPEELAARKLLALFDRAMPRDFVDVFHLARRWDRKDLMALASTIDSGFETSAFATALRQLDRYCDCDIPMADSSGQRNDLGEFLVRHRISEGLSRAAVEASLDGEEVVC